MANKRSAKDIAFDKERAKFRHKINELEREIQSLNKIIEGLRSDKSSLEKENEHLITENNTLKMTSEVSIEDLKMLIEEAKYHSELREKVSNFFSIRDVISTVGYNNSIFKGFSGSLFDELF